MYRFVAEGFYSEDGETTFETWELYALNEEEARRICASRGLRVVRIREFTAVN